MSTVMTGTDLSKALISKLSLDAQRARSVFVNGKARTSGEEREQKRRAEKKLLVKGRVVGGSTVWDVFELSGFSEPVLIGANFAFQEEAIFFARDRSLGRVVVGRGGLRGVFRRSSSGLCIPDRSVESPNQSKPSQVKMVVTDDGVVIG